MYKMMIVDDEPLTREYMKSNIQAISDEWQVTAEAMEGCEALEILERLSVDLVMTDIKMPVMDGLELCRIISEKYPGQKVVILSGYDEFAYAKEAMKYGVQEYLLKPIVREEVRAALDKIAGEIENEKKKALAYRALISLSEDSQKQIIKDFLKAVVSDAGVEIKSLYPGVLNLKSDLMQSTGIIMLLDLDEDFILEKSLDLARIPVLRLELHRTAAEIVESGQAGYVFFDNEENTVVFLTGTDSNEMIEKGREIYSKIASAFYERFEITISGAVGNPENDLLQLNRSYHNACKIFSGRLCSGGSSVYIFNDSDRILELNKRLNKIISAILWELQNNNEMMYCRAVLDYVDLIDGLTVSSMYGYGVYLIRSVAKFNRDSGEQVNSALELLKNAACGTKNEITKDHLVNTFVTVIKFFANHAFSKQDSVDEQDIVKKVKEYIYTHYSEPISLALISGKLGISAGYLSILFHKNVGESYIKFLTKVRMQQAEKLLTAKPAEKVHIISEKVGYVSVKHFSSVFKKHFNVSPGEYQERRLKRENPT